jgi:hypothetical protein
LGWRWIAWIPYVSRIATKKGEKGGTIPAKMETRKKGHAVAGMLSCGVRPFQM